MDDEAMNEVIAALVGGALTVVVFGGFYVYDYFFPGRLPRWDMLSNNPNIVFDPSL